MASYINGKLRDSMYGELKNKKSKEISKHKKIFLSIIFGVMLITSSGIADMTTWNAMAVNSIPLATQSQMDQLYDIGDETRNNIDSGSTSSKNLRMKAKALKSKAEIDDIVANAMEDAAEEMGLDWFKINKEILMKARNYLSKSNQEQFNQIYMKIIGNLVDMYDGKMINSKGATSVAESTARLLENWYNLMEPINMDYIPLGLKYSRPNYAIIKSGKIVTVKGSHWKTFADWNDDFKNGNIMMDKVFGNIARPGRFAFDDAVNTAQKIKKTKAELKNKLRKKFSGIYSSKKTNYTNKMKTTNEVDFLRSELQHEVYIRGRYSFGQIQANLRGGE